MDIRYCVTACVTCVYFTVFLALQANREVLKASGHSGHVTRLSGIGSVQMWHQWASHSLPPPPLSLSPSHSLPRSVLLCSFPPLSFSFAVPQHPPCWRWCVSGVFRQAGPKRRGQLLPPSPTPGFLPFFGCPFAVSCSSTAVAASRLSPYPASLCGCLWAGPSGVGGGGNKEHASPGSCIELAMPCPGILWPAGSLRAHHRTS